MSGVAGAGTGTELGIIGGPNKPLPVLLGIIAEIDIPSPFFGQDIDIRTSLAQYAILYIIGATGSQGIASNTYELPVLHRALIRRIALWAQPRPLLVG